MKILIDIGHPAHVHYFRNFIKIMESKKHDICVISREREIILKLLRFYNIDYIGRGRGSNSIIGKILYFIKTIFYILIISLKFRPDIYLSQGGVYTSIVSYIFMKPNLVLEDTEIAKNSHLISRLFDSFFIHPDCFQKKISNNEVRYSSMQELLYLHPKRFSPNKDILDFLDIKENENYFIIRFVSWNAHHDVGQSGLSIDIKNKLINHLSKFGKVFISSECILPEHLKKYRIKIPPEKIHDALFYATLFISEGATMSSESAVLGTPSFYVNSLQQLGYLEEGEKYGLVYKFSDSTGVLLKSLELVKNSNIDLLCSKRKKNLLRDKIDVTAFLVWFIENYPLSKKTMKNNPDYQYRFK